MSISKQIYSLYLKNIFNTLLTNGKANKTEINTKITLFRMKKMGRQQKLKKNIHLILTKLQSILQVLVRTSWTKPRKFRGKNGSERQMLNTVIKANLIMVVWSMERCVPTQK